MHRQSHTAAHYENSLYFEIKLVRISISYKKTEHRIVVAHPQTMRESKDHYHVLNLCIPSDTRETNEYQETTFHFPVASLVLVSYRWGFFDYGVTGERG